MRHMLGDHFEKMGGLSEAEISRALLFFERTEVRRREVLRPAGEVPGKLWYVEAGLLRLAILQSNGQEQTLQFALEGWWLEDLMAYLRRLESEFSVEAVEDSVVQAISWERYEALFEAEPKMERYFRKIYERGFAAAQRRQHRYELKTAGVRYDEFVKSYPEFVERIPQYMLASFLGVTPEFLSRLRRRRAARRT
jgi:CRP-like cAMP-binding protein